MHFQCVKLQIADIDMDTVSKRKRSEVMGQVKSKDTTPEMLVRRLVHRMGYRYRLHRKDLPGKPDLVFPGRKKVIFVHGCFWHRHQGCSNTRTPKSRTNFWETKFQQNVERDRRVCDELQAMGWDFMIIWECQTKDETLIAEQVDAFLKAN